MNVVLKIPSVLKHWRCSTSFTDTKDYSYLDRSPCRKIIITTDVRNIRILIINLCHFQETGVSWLGLIKMTSFTYSYLLICRGVGDLIKPYSRSSLTADFHEINDECCIKNSLCFETLTLGITGCCSASNTRFDNRIVLSF
jgi:hypothetical protein